MFCKKCGADIKSMTGKDKKTGKRHTVMFCEKNCDGSKEYLNILTPSVQEQPLVSLQTMMKAEIEKERPYYRDDWVTIYNADCMDILGSLAPVDVVIADPPYGVQYAKWDFERPDGIWIEYAKQLCETVAVHAAQGEIWNMPKPDWIMAWFMPGSTNRTKAGNFRHWEPVLIYGKEKASVDSKVFPPIGGQRNRHPCPKPDKVAKWLVSCLSNEGDLILDPFMGSGTTLVAAKILGRKAIGIEIEEKYCKIAVDRLRQDCFNFSRSI